MQIPLQQITNRNNETWVLNVTVTCFCVCLLFTCTGTVVLLRQSGGRHNYCAQEDIDRLPYGIWFVGSGALTCDQIEQLGQSVSELEVSKLETLSAAEYTDCAYLLGRVANFTSEQWTAIAAVAKKVQRVLYSYGNLIDKRKNE